MYHTKAEKYDPKPQNTALKHFDSNCTLDDLHA